jgi:hypothetical protein
MSETTPLLVGSAQEQSPSQDVYDRFTTTQKRVITMVISAAGLIGRECLRIICISIELTDMNLHACTAFASGCFVPCVPEISKDLNTTGTVVK